MPPRTVALGLDTWTQEFPTTIFPDLLSISVGSSSHPLLQPVTHLTDFLILPCMIMHKNTFCTCSSALRPWIVRYFRQFLASMFSVNSVNSPIYQSSICCFIRWRMSHNIVTPFLHWRITMGYTAIHSEFHWCSTVPVRIRGKSVEQ